MNERDEHLSFSDLNELIESGRDADALLKSDGHLSRCPDCRGSLIQLARIDRALRILPLPRLGVKFTERVMKHVAPGAGQARVYRVITRGASILVAMTGLAFIVSGYLIVGRLLSAAPEQSSPSLIVQGITTTGDAVRWGTGWLSEHLANVLGTRTNSSLALALVGGATILLLDRIIARVFRRRISSGG